MKKLYTLSFILQASLSFEQAFTATYDFSLVTTTSGQTNPSPVPVVAGLTFESFVAVNPSATNITGAGRSSFVDQPLGAVASDNVYANHTGVIGLGTYFQVAITLKAGTSLDLS